MSYLSVSTWSLNRLLGPLRWTVWDAATGCHSTKEQEQPQEISLLELPAEAARRGYHAVEICHFHFPSTEEDYLVQLRDAFSASGISFDTLLLDYGDLTASEESRRTADFEFIRRWIGFASLCGAKQIRVIAGEAPPADELAIRRSAAALSELAEYARAQGVRVVTENFKPLTSTGESCMKLLGLAGSQVGMITDFGNFNGQAKYGEIAMTAPYSVSVHAKAEYDEAGIPNVEEFRHCLDAVKSVGYDGAYVLIYDGPGNMWEGLERIKRLVQPYITN